MSEAAAAHEVDGRLFLEHEGVNLIWIDASGLAFLLLDKHMGYGVNFRSQGSSLMGSSTLVAAHTLPTVVPVMLRDKGR